MRGRLTVLVLAAALSAGTPALAITNGALDGSTHPAIGFLMATNPGDICSGGHQLISDCSVVLIAPDLALTTGDCASAFADSLVDGLIDQVWVIFDADPTGPISGAYDCTKFIDVDETEIVANPAWLANTNTGANLGVLRLVSPLSITPVQLPTENRLRTVQKRTDNLTAVAIGGTTTQSGYDIFQARRRFSLASVNKIDKGEYQTVILASGGSPDQACFGYATDGGAVLLGSTNEVVTLTRGSFSVPCQPRAGCPRLDTANARAFLGGYVTLP